MFDLEQAIAEWRRHMTAEGIKSPEVLRELETHLREDIERQLQAGLKAQQAFESAVQRLGQPRALEMEFAKVGSSNEAQKQRLVQLCGIIPAGIAVITGIAYFLVRESNWSGRIPGFAVVALIALYLFGLPYSYRFLPAIENQRSRVIMQLAGTFVWLLLGVLIMDAVLPLLNLASSEPAVTLWVMMSVVAALPWIQYGLDDDSLPSSPDVGGPFPPSSPAPIPPVKPVSPEVRRLASVNWKQPLVITPQPA